jgi:uncharacterized protein affecting Mg2+/Co2+ transport
LSNPVPSSLALINVAPGAPILSADHRTNYSDIQTRVNALITALSGGVSGQVLQAAGASSVQWATASTIYRKTSAAAATNTVAETDLLAGAISVGAGLLGTTGAFRLTMWGDWVQTSGGNVGLPRWKVKLGAGATVVLDTNTLAAASASSGARYPWRATVEVMNLGATNVQLVFLEVRYAIATTGVGNEQNFTTGEGINGYVGTAATVIQATAIGYNSAAIDTTVAMPVVFSVINPSASSTETKLLGALGEVI